MALAAGIGSLDLANIFLLGSNLDSTDFTSTNGSVEVLAGGGGGGGPVPSPEPATLLLLTGALGFLLLLVTFKRA